MNHKKPVGAGGRLIGKEYDGGRDHSAHHSTSVTASFDILDCSQRGFLSANQLHLKTPLWQVTLRPWTDDRNGNTQSKTQTCKTRPQDRRTGGLIP